MMMWRAYLHLKAIIGEAASSTPRVSFRHVKKSWKISLSTTACFIGARRNFGDYFKYEELDIVDTRYYLSPFPRPTTPRQIVTETHQEPSQCSYPARAVYKVT